MNRLEDNTGSQPGNRPDPHHRRLGQLVDRLAAGELGDDEHAELDAIVGNDPLARQYYLEQTFLVGSLLWRCGGHQNPAQQNPVRSSAAPTATAAPPAAPSVLGFLGDAWQGTYLSPRILVTIVGSALASYFLVMYALIPLTRWAPLPNGAAQVSSAHDDLSAVDHSSLQANRVPGEKVGALKADLQASWPDPAAAPSGAAARVGQRCELAAGHVEMTLERGARLMIAGPAVWQLDSEQRLSLARGRVAVYVPVAAKGFTVITPTAEIVDLGTEFMVEVGDSAETRLAVGRGKVQVATITPTASRSKSKARPALVVSAGQAITVSATGAGRVTAESTSFDSEWVRRMTRLGQLSVRDEVIAYQATPIGLAGNYPALPRWETTFRSSYRFGSPVWGCSILVEMGSMPARR